ncbi:hypothetical protein N0V90_000602 [Kalmusia sp. IMI 367209]|nr:hypothetical protein N0V90_000602 [Kalmusia sp. IMI 367209]
MSQLDRAAFLELINNYELNDPEIDHAGFVDFVMFITEKGLGKAPAIKKTMGLSGVKGRNRLSVEDHYRMVKMVTHVYTALNPVIHTLKCQYPDRKELQDYLHQETGFRIPLETIRKMLSCDLTKAETGGVDSALSPAGIYALTEEPSTPGSNLSFSSPASSMIELMSASEDSLTGMNDAQFQSVNILLDSNEPNFQYLGTSEPIYPGMAPPTTAYQQYVDSDYIEEDLQGCQCPSPVMRAYALGFSCGFRLSLDFDGMPPHDDMEYDIEQSSVTDTYMDDDEAQSEYSTSDYTYLQPDLSF